MVSKWKTNCIKNAVLYMRHHWACHDLSFSLASNWCNIWFHKTISIFINTKFHVCRQGCCHKQEVINTFDLISLFSMCHRQLSFGLFSSRKAQQTLAQGRPSRVQHRTDKCIYVPISFSHTFLLNTWEIIAWIFFFFYLTKVNWNFIGIM